MIITQGQSEDKDKLEELQYHLLALLRKYDQPIFFCYGLKLKDDGKSDLTFDGVNRMIMENTDANDYRLEVDDNVTFLKPQKDK